MDVNYYSIADTDNVEVVGVTLPGDPFNDPRNYSDILKLSHATNILVKDCVIYGGKEDCIDMNRYCDNIVVDNCRLASGGLYVATIKGGTKNVTFQDVIVTKHGKETDIDIGNWSDQSNEMTKNITLDNVTSTDGKPVRVRVLWADRPLVIGGNVKVTVIPKWAVAIYRFLRRFHLVP